MKNQFPQRLRQLRQARGITQADLGRYLHYKHTAVANYESGRNQPSFDDLLKLADYFAVSTDFLLGSPKQPAAECLWEKELAAQLRHLLGQLEEAAEDCRTFLEKLEKKI